jgi:hypothetical protein
MTTVYLMARYGRHPEMQGVATRLMQLGYCVTSRWIWGTHQASDAAIGTGTLGDLECHIAQEDWTDLQAADLCIGFSEPRQRHTLLARILRVFRRLPPSRGGRHVELGLALAWGKRVLIVGGSEHVFHALPQVEHVAATEALYALLGPASAAPGAETFLPQRSTDACLHSTRC